MTVACVLTTENDLEARIARMCEAVEWIECAAHDGCGCGVALSCRRDTGHDGNHRDIGGMEWLVTE